jgi:hypothetical protein
MEGLSMNRFGRTFSAIASKLFLLCAIAGCTSNERTCYPVAGRVLLDGQPWTEKGSLLLELIESAQISKSITARAQVDAQGGFQVSTFGVNDGAVPGKYRVIVLPPATAGDGPPRPAKLPLRYQSSSTSQLDVEVKPTINELELLLFSSQ